MSGEPSDAEAVAVDEREHPAAEIEITPRLIGLSMGAGLVGLLVMAPILAGVPAALGVFRVEPLVEFANIGSLFGLRPELIGPILGFNPDVVVGAILFGAGGVLFLPVQFLVVGSFLPPDSPRFARGGSFAMLWWSGFLFAFWPGGTALAMGVFFVVSLAAHLAYGMTLGYLIDRFAEIPQHEV